jgi:hypothetical protein
VADENGCALNSADEGAPHDTTRLPVQVVGLWCLVTRRHPGLMVVYGVTMLLVTTGEAWFTIELFTDGGRTFVCVYWVAVGADP